MSTRKELLKTVRLPARIEHIPIELIKPNPKNARTHTRQQLRKIQRSIEIMGFTNPVLVDENNVLLAGHGRILAAQMAGLTTAPVVKFGHLSPAQKRAYLIADNAIAAAAGWDRELLATEVQELIELLPAEELDLSLIGLDVAEIDLLIADMGADSPVEADALPPIPRNPITRSGDLWKLGNHRLLCGDAREPSHLDRLLGGSSIAAAFCDVPYNLRVRSIVGRGRTKHSEFACASGEMSDPKFGTFLTTTLANAIRVSRPGAVHYVCMDWRHIETLLKVGREIYSDILNLVVWNKTNAGQGSFYRSQHELIAVFRAGDAPHKNNIELGRFGRSRSNVWTYAGQNTFGRGRMDALMAHPTVKPTALVADALLDCTSRGDAVLDHFAGSGTILLAAEKVGRHAYALEIEPRYVDVAIKRWQDATKIDAVLIGEGRTFEEIASERNRVSGGAFNV